MKRIILVIILAVIGKAAFAQKEKEAVVTPYPVHTDSITKLISYEGVMEVKNMPASMIYKKVNAWFQTYYKNPAEVIRENDSIKFSMTGKPRFRLNNPPDKDGNKVEGGFVQYTITVKAKDGRFRYELTEFNMKQSSYFPCERWLDTKAKSYFPVYNDYLKQLEDYSLETINSLRNAVSKEKPVKDRDNW